MDDDDRNEAVSALKSELSQEKAKAKDITKANAIVDQPLSKTTTAASGLNVTGIGIGMSFNFAIPDEDNSDKDKEEDYQENLLIEDSQDDLYDHPTNTEESSETISVALTPGENLNSEGHYLQLKLINNQLSDSEINLEVMHDRYNDKDDLALQVFCNRTPIGFILKQNNEKDIDVFSFIDNEKIESLTLTWQNNHFLLSRTLSHSENLYHINIYEEHKLIIKELQLKISKLQVEIEEPLSEAEEKKLLELILITEKMDEMQLEMEEYKKLHLSTLEAMVKRNEFLLKFEELLLKSYEQKLELKEIGEK